MQNVALRLAYDGSAFFGFQKQSGDLAPRTVQSVLEEALSRVLGRPTRVIAAGRTDAGVHARGQVVNFLTDGRMAPEGIAYHLARYLPEDVLALESHDVALSFHARFSAKEKEYRYCLSTAERLYPTERHYKGHCSYPLDEAAMRKTCTLFCGLHDFSAFSRQDPQRTPLRHLQRFDMERRGEDLLFTLSAESFLRHQVRILVGALVEVGRGRLSSERIIRLLAQGAERPVAPTYPAAGLTLQSVRFSEVKSM